MHNQRKNRVFKIDTHHRRSCGVLVQHFDFLYPLELTLASLFRHLSVMLLKSLEEGSQFTIFLHRVSTGGTEEKTNDPLQHFPAAPILAAEAEGRRHILGHKNSVQRAIANEDSCTTIIDRIADSEQIFGSRESIF
jgi:hypothetical protein